MKCKQDKKKVVAVRPDNIIEARFSLTSRQNDILDMLFAEIKDDEQYEYELSVEKYKKLYNIDTSNLYRDLKKAVKNFEGQGFRVVIDKDKNEEIYFAWFSKIHYIPKEGKIKLNIDRDLKKMFYEVKKRIYYDIEYTLNFSSSYSQRMYYYLKSFEDTGWRKDSIEELQNKLECPKTYRNFSNMKKYVLDVAKSEINSTSDIMFDYDIEYTGRKVTHVSYNISKKCDIKNPNMNELALELDSNDLNNEFIINTTQCNFSDEDLLKIINACDSGFKLQSKLDNKRRYFLQQYDIANKYFEKQDKQGDFIAILITALKDNWGKSNYKKRTVIKKDTTKQLKFTDYEQREYDYEQLEEDLLGWMNKE